MGLFVRYKAGALPQCVTDRDVRLAEAGETRPRGSTRRDFDVDRQARRAPSSGRHQQSVHFLGPHLTCRSGLGSNVDANRMGAVAVRVRRRFEQLRPL